MDEKLFTQFRDIIYRASGISLSEEKKALLTNRLFKRLRALKMTDEHAYLELLLNDKSGREMSELIDAISTNVTYFFRESEHFDVLKTLCDSWTQKGVRKLRVWCAASSSGEEPYTIAITLKENLDTSRIDTKILATDICTPVLQHAMAGVYEEKQLQHAPPAIRAKYFNKAANNGHVRWQVKKELQEMVTFKRLNLAKAPFPLKGPIDVIFCRNVMIYFDLAMRRQAVGEFHRLLCPGGHFFLSRSENLLGVDTPFKRVESSVYMKSEPGQDD